MDKLIANDSEAVSLQLLMAKGAPFTRALQRISGGSNQEVLHICLCMLAANSRRVSPSDVLADVEDRPNGWSGRWSARLVLVVV